MPITLTIANQGAHTETLTVNVYANTALIATGTITLTGGKSKTLTFIWDTTGFAKGKYTISAYALPVPGETDLDDNSNTVGGAKVTIPGDVDGDNLVSVYDAIELLSRYSARIGDLQYDPICDIDNDGVIFLLDAVILLSHYGQKDQ
jgi:hypothetical protein